MTLTAHDRCDNGGCNAAAYVRVMFRAGLLDFCAHHAHEHRAAIATGLDVLDERDRLTVAP
jgi:hypothetical protein